MFRVNTWFRFTDEYYGFGSTVAPLKKAAFNRLLGWPLKATLNESTGFNWKLQWKAPICPAPVPPDSIMTSSAGRNLSSAPGPLELRGY
jgi:hypothetical protein